MLNIPKITLNVIYKQTYGGDPAAFSIVLSDHKKGNHNNTVFSLIRETELRNGSRMQKHIIRDPFLFRKYVCFKTNFRKIMYCNP